MKVLLWHGYLLTGSGSNVYTANLARAWRAAGHDVLVLCQERDGAVFGFVDEEGDFSPDNSSFLLRPTGAPQARGRCRLARPAIGDILPLYVYDEYPGFSAKLYVDLTDAELSDYTRRNVAALVVALEEHQPDAVITGHEVMGPYIAKVACERTGHGFTAKLHGSALEYAVKRQERYLDFARQGLSAADVVVGGSRYMVSMASSVVPGGWAERAEVVNPGCDVSLFRPLPKDELRPPTVGFVGKLIAAKGVHNLLAALGLTHTPGLTAVMVGYGALEGELRALQQAVGAGDRQGALRIARAGGTDLEELVGFLRRQTPDYWERAASVTVVWPGRLDHDPLAEVLPAWDALVVPSVVPEAFGMVAAEAAACGVLPIVPAHSGIGEAGAAVESAIGLPGFLTFDPDDPIAGIAEAIDRVLAVPPDERAALGRDAVQLARARWSWDRVAERLLALATRGSN